MQAATNFHQAFTTLQQHGAALLTKTEETMRRLPVVEVGVLKHTLLTQSPAAGFIESDWAEWITPAVLSHMLTYGRFMPRATPVREELGIPLRCHFTVLDRWRERIGSQAYFGFGLYWYNNKRYWWLHSWLIDAEGVLIDSALGRDEQTLYFGVPWSWGLLTAVNKTDGHPFEELLLKGLTFSAL